METERIREMLRIPIRDNVSGRAQLEALRPLVADLLDAYEAEVTKDGGEFGRKLLEAIEARVITELNGRAELSDQVKIITCAAYVAGQKVFIDSRLEVSCLSI